MKKLPEMPSSQASGQDAESPFKSAPGLTRIVNAIKYSIRGLRLAFRLENAFRQELALAAVLIPLALLLQVPSLERLALIGSVILVLIVELLNSSVEAAVDRISLDHHTLSGRAKDFGSAAVFLTLLLCGLTWLTIAGPVLLSWF